MFYSSLEPSRRGDSNDSKFIPIQSLSAEIINETACGAVSINEKCWIINISSNCKPSNDGERLNYSSLESSRWDESNGVNCILTWPLDGSQFDETLMVRHFSFTLTAPHAVSSIISAPSDYIGMNLLPFESPRRDGSNEL
jgi:hypothetical protein